MSTFVAESPTNCNEPKPLSDVARFQDLGVNSLVVGCLTVLLTVSDAFETGHFGLAHQVALWCVVSVLLVSQLTAAKYLLDKILPSKQYYPVLAMILALAATLLLMTIELNWLKYTPLLPKQPDPFFEFLVFLTPPMGTIASLVLLAQHLSQQNRRLQALHAEQVVAPREERVDEQHTHGDQKAIPASKDVMDLASVVHQYTVKHVQAEDHYLSVNCLEQNFLIRSRMKDALICLQSIQGIQVHRSHWVAVDHIERLYREGRDSKLLLKDGNVIPVSRSRVNELRALLVTL